MPDKFSTVRSSVLVMNATWVASLLSYFIMMTAGNKNAQPCKT